MDTRVFGPGERIVFEPYTREMYEETQRWIDAWSIFEEGLKGRSGYEEALISQGRK